MERSGGLLRALFAGVEPIIVGLISKQQWLVLLGLCNICIVLLRHNTQPQTKSPLNSHVFSYKSQLQNLKTQNNYFGAIGFIGLIGGIISYVLQQGAQFDKVALGLMTAGGIYWILSSVIHGIRTTRSAGVSKLFAALIVVGAGRAFLGSQNGQTILNTFPSKISKLFSVPTASAPTITNNTKVPSATGTVTTGVTSTGNTPTTPASTGTTAITNPEAAKDNTKALSYAQVVPAIVKAFNLPAGADVGFANISKTNSLYTAFKAGYAARFFGLNVNPNTLATCNVYFVMLGLAEKWPVSYTPATVFTAYAAEATKRGKTYGCKAGAYVTQANLP